MKTREINIIETPDIDRYGFLATAITPSTEGLNTTRLTKEMRDDFLVEPVLRQHLLARKQGEPLGGHEGKNESLLLTMRTIARHRLREIHLDLVSHRPAMTSASMLLHNIRFNNYLFIPERDHTDTRTTREKYRS